THLYTLSLHDALPIYFLLQFHPGCGLRPQVREIRPRGPADREHLIEARLSKGLEDDRLIGMELVAVPLDDGRVEPQLAIHPALRSEEHTSELQSPCNL